MTVPNQSLLSLTLRSSSDTLRVGTERLPASELLAPPAPTPGGGPDAHEAPAMIRAQAALVRDLESNPLPPGMRARELEIHRRSLDFARELSDQARNGPLIHARAHADITVFDVPPSHRKGLGKLVTLSKRAAVATLTPALRRILLPQQRFNHAWLQAIDGAPSGVRAILEGALPPSPSTVRAPTLLKRLLSVQAEFNHAAVAATSIMLDGGSLASAWQLLQRMRGIEDPFMSVESRSLDRALSPVAREVFRRQVEFNRAAADYVEGRFSERAPRASAHEVAHQRAYLSHVETLDASAGLLAAAKERGKDPLRGIREHGLKTIIWFVPAFAHPYGGIHTILRFGDLLRRRHGVKNYFVAYDNDRASESELEARVSTLFPELPGEFRVIRGGGADIDKLPDCDLAIATLWTSAYALLRYGRAHSYAYFIQDFETLFYPAGTYQALTDETYRLGYYGLFNTRGLFESVTARHPMQGCWFEPTVEREVFHDRRPAKSPDAPVRIFFYGRPSTDRNAFELGLATLRALKAEFGARVDIITAGEQWRPEDFDVAGVIRNLGVLPYDKTGDLYRSCDMGLCFMFTKHPSYLPLEMMACGVAVVTNRNPSNLWLLEHEVNCLLAEPSFDEVVAQLRRAVSDRALRERLGAAGAERVTRTTWEAQADKVWAALTEKAVTP